MTAPLSSSSAVGFLGLAIFGIPQKIALCVRGALPGAPITEAELQYGLARSPNAKTLRPAMEGFLAKIQILPWGRDEAHTYGRLRAKQEAAGKPLGNLDMLIAAHAVSVGAILVTNDKAFSYVSDLSGTLNWATDR